MKPITCEQSRQADQRAINHYGVPGIILMENAAHHLLQAAMAMLQLSAKALPTTAILCGAGNNGGDGYALARLLATRNLPATIYALRSPAKLTGDAAVQANIVQKMGLPIFVMENQDDIAKYGDDWDNATLIVDALLGTGFNGDVRGLYKNAIARCNQAHHNGVKVLAVDVPSGLNADTGLPSNATIEADATVTFVAVKTGLVQAGAQTYTGKLTVGDIGLPAALLVGKAP